MTDTAVDTTGALTTEKNTSRKYVKTATNDKGEVIIKDYAIQAETQAKETAEGPQKGMAVNWAKLEKEGYSVFNENEFIKYNVKSKAGAELLVPDETQFVYIFQSGLNYLQNNKINRLMNEMVENSPEPTPTYSNETIDLRDYINEPPVRKTTTPLEKIQKQIAALGLNQDQIDDILRQLAAAQSETEEVTA